MNSLNSIFNDLMLFRITDFTSIDMAVPKSLRFIANSGFFLTRKLHYHAQIELDTVEQIAAVAAYIELCRFFPSLTIFITIHRIIYNTINRLVPTCHQTDHLAQDDVS